MVLHWIEEQVKPDKFMILGYSMGGIVTSVLCNEVPLDGICCGAHAVNPMPISAICWGRNYLKKDFREMMWTLWATWFPMNFLRGWTAPQIDLWPPYGILKKPLRLIQGDGDKDVPVYNSRRYQETVPKAVRHVISGATHGYDRVSWQRELLDYTKGL